MPQIGVRELKTHASRLVRAGRRQRTRYTLTSRGQPVALLIPLADVPDASFANRNDTAWDELTRLAHLIAGGWCAPETSAELLTQLRR